MKFSLNSALGTITTASIATAITAATAIYAPSAQAAKFEFGFQNINSSNTNGDAIVNQFSFTLEDSGSGKTLWKFNNAGPTASFIGSIYFDWKPITGSLLSISALNDSGTSTGVNFVPTTGKMPQAQDVDTLLSDTLGFDNSTGNQDANLAIQASELGSNKKGIDAGETLAILFNSTDATTLAGLIEADRLRVGMHVQGIAPNGGSDAFFDGPLRPVPVPGFLLGLVAAGGFGASRVIKSKKQATV